MTEAALQAAVIECARLFKWRVAHFRPAQTVRGWRTPVQGDGAGFPDLVLIRGPTLMFVELKAARGKVSRDQAEWLNALEQTPAIVHVWRPDDWLSGAIEEALR